MSTNTKRWRFIAGDKRHTVEMEHNVVTGKQVIKLDGKLIHFVKAKYQLTGDVKFKIDDIPARLSIQADSGVMGGFRYLVLLEGTPVPDEIPTSRLENFYVTCDFKEGHKNKVNVQFDHQSFDVWVDDTRLSLEKGELEADFLEDGCEGSVYKFSLPNGCPAQIQVTPIKGKGGSKASLFVGKDLRQVDSGAGSGHSAPTAPLPSSEGAV